MRAVVERQGDQAAGARTAMVTAAGLRRCTDRGKHERQDEAAGDSC
jgi:hypothetical protein